ncbi:hypothetical protein HBI04_019730 [Parastagonospora nodorum]|nr:hypothetical protein HBH51_173530 [Parastagonospora nodorum]KAH4101397.1 hypothetical protein HBH46_138400 [Parastagonospora nodorum]KAH4265296.1 hypothetical protein HBI03_081310 [Parastagonospora nodorum]KAH4283176.1 hypothetical protein HBI04_019730 [Parastagonospora nodorum]KAH5122946.1 hypothetical protein HBH71_038180 [Parastagonospora nodorum]
MYMSGLDSASANPQLQPLPILYSLPAPQHLNTPPVPEQAAYPSPPPFGGDKAVEVSLDLVGDAEQEQENLRDVRDELLGARFRLQASRKELGNLRQESGAKDGHVFSMVRRLIVDRPNDLTRQFEEALDEASKLRDRLGLLEASYEESEQRYNTMEWKYTRKESSFVERLLPSDDFLAERPGNTKETAEMAELTRFAGPQQDLSGEAVVQTYPSKLRTLEDQHGLSDLLPETEAGEMLSSTASCRQPSLPPPIHISTESLHSPCEEKNTAPTMTGNQIGLFDVERNNDTGGTDAQLTWATKVRRIDEWLLFVLAMSPLQQAQLKTMHYLDFPVSISAFHTGDSSNGSDPLMMTSDDALSDEPAARLSDHIPSIQIDPTVEDSENVELPTGIDLNDPTETESYQIPDFTPKQYGVHLSASTDPTPSRRTSASEESHRTGMTSENSAGGEDCQHPDLQRSEERTQSTASLGTTTQENFRSTPGQSIHDDESLLSRLEVESIQMGTETSNGRKDINMVEEAASGNDESGSMIVRCESGQRLFQYDQGHQLQKTQEANSPNQSLEIECQIAPHIQLDETNNCAILPLED